MSGAPAEENRKLKGEQRLRRGRGAYVYSRIASCRGKRQNLIYELTK